MSPSDAGGAPQGAGRGSSHGSGALSPLEIARAYLAGGWQPIPVPYGTKAPILDAWPTLRVTELTAAEYFNERPSNIGVLLGDPSGGLVDVDHDCTEAIALAPTFLPFTPARFGRASRRESHRLYVSPGLPTEKFEDVEPHGDDGTMLLELRSTGVQTIFPGSVHPDGELVEWHAEGEPAGVTGADLRRAVVHLACATLLARHWPAHGSRHETALAAAGFLLRAGLDESTTVNIVTAAARAAKDPEWSDRKRAALDTVAALASGEPTTGGPRLAELLSGDGRRVLQRIRKWLGVEGREPAFFPLTDLGNAERLVDQHGRDLRYCYALRSWFSWTGSRWERDAGAIVMSHAKHTVRTIYSEAVAGADPAARAAVAAWARKSEHEALVRAAVFLARSEPGIPIEVAQFDTNPWALNVANGVVDLRTGQLRPPRREDYLSKLAPVAFDPAARCPRWLRFLSEIFNANETMIAFIQKAIGYALTGVTTEQVFFLLYGIGANGKTTLLKVIAIILGDYAMSTRPETFMVKGPDAIPNDVARLRGARLVTAVEADNGQRLAEALMKQMTGGDVMTARFMRAEFFDFVPEFKIFLASNFKPVIRGSDHAMWRRVRLVPFDVAIPPEKQDRQLEVALRAEAPGILAWAVQGCLAWQREGLGLPDKVRVATDAYRVEMDVLGQFIADRCRIDGAGGITTAELYGAYRSWCDEVRETPMSKRTFGLRLADRGVTQARSKAARGWRGIRLRTPQDTDEPADSGDASAPVTQETGESGMAEVRARINESPGNKRHVASPTGDASPDEDEILL